MSTTGANTPDPIVIEARRILLDALDALQEQLDALILVGAQAVYLHTGEGDLAVSPYTADADLVIIPTKLTDDPRLEVALKKAGLINHPNHSRVGSWVQLASTFENVCVDFLVPEGLAAPEGSRAARLDNHGDRIARKAKGLEAAAIEREPWTIEALGPADTRRRTVWVAGPAALLVAKMHKLNDRITGTKPGAERRKNKDALDIYRLLRAKSTQEMADRLRGLLADETSKWVTQGAVDILRSLFGAEDAEGCMMAGENVAGVSDPSEIRAATYFMAIELLTELDQTP